jgi:hypothetical protein
MEIDKTKLMAIIGELYVENLIYKERFSQLQ